ncbi:MAG: ATP-binding protein [Blautia sp.]|uniref:ATP-binding protein n=1 Tax=Blautia sp. TaxID=1955243 RepID=UPI0025826134|nr:ATP-binding protein [Blautia sp.]MCI7289590.1 ATP-binding protein [Blautia sp.]
MWYPVAGTTVPYLRNCGTRLLEQWCNSGRNLQLFKVIADRSERGSTIVTTNLAFSEWTNLFENTAMVAALVDRLTFRSYVLDMNGDSYRLDHSKNSA